MGSSQVWFFMSFLMAVVSVLITESMAGPFSNAETIYKPWKVRTSLDKKKVPAVFFKKVHKVSHSPPIFRTPTVPRQQQQQPDDQEPDWSAAEMMQRPIDEPENRQTDRGLGSPCSYSRDCSSGCCLLDRSTKIRSCQPKARTSDRCSNFQVKGDLYVDACPCIRGSNHCSLQTKRCSWS